MSEPVGRPTKYKKEYAEQAFKYCLLGATNERLAEFFDVGITTIDRWLSDHDKFRGAVKRGRKDADAEIASSLYHRAKGYSHKEDKIFPPRGRDEEPIIVPTIKHYPPDTAAAFIWLKNRQGWSDKSTQEHTGPNGGPIQLEKLSDEDLATKIALLTKPTNS